MKFILPILISLLIFSGFMLCESIVRESRRALAAGHKMKQVSDDWEAVSKRWEDVAMRNEAALKDVQSIAREAQAIARVAISQRDECSRELIELKSHQNFFVPDESIAITKTNLYGF